MNFYRAFLLRLLLPIGLCMMGVALFTWLIPGEIEAVKQQLIGFPDSDAPSHKIRPLVMAALCFMPALGALFYAIFDTLDRYVIRQFLGIFFISLIALLMIWLLVDLGDKISDFRSSDSLLRTIGSFYLTRSPSIIPVMIPYSILLSLLYSLGKLSASREIIAMIQAGRSLLRIVAPLIIMGILFSFLNLGFNYHWTPVAEGTADQMLAEASGKNAEEASKVLYRSPENRRLWMIGSFPRNYQMGAPLLDVEITTTHADQTMESRLRAKSASWNRETHQWTFHEPVLGNFQANQPTVFTAYKAPLVVDLWTETPWQLIKPGLSAEFLGIPDLTSWLQANRHAGMFSDPAPYETQWHYRWALPFNCLITVLLAAPLGIHFSRRGAGGGAFLAIFLAGLMLLFTSISVALGASSALSPALAAWLPSLIFTLLAFYLFYRRISGQPIYILLRRMIPGCDSSN